MKPSVIFHFQKELDNILHVLQEGQFNPRVHFEIVGSSRKPYYLTPMTCFCDMSLSEALGGHTSKYGKFAVGVKKEWAIRKSVSPVFYTTGKNSRLTQISTSLTNTIVQLATPHIADGVLLPESPVDTDVLYDALLFNAFVKPYVGFNPGQSESEEYQQFWKEREWRFVPEVKGTFSNGGSIGILLTLQRAEHIWDHLEVDFDKSDRLAAIAKNGEDLKARLNEFFSDFPLKLDSDAISYVIVEEQKDLQKVRQVLERSSVFSDVVDSVMLISLDRIGSDII
ncbi:MAG: abortive infection system antitoxin AbiGi family protein [Flavobacteriales bacterium]